MLPHYRPEPLPSLTAKQKYECNLQALRVLRDLRRQPDGSFGEAREATEVERAVLGRYVGWGQNEVRKHAFDWDGRPSAEIAELGLGRDVLAGMQRSTLNAHYTSIEVVDALWAIAQRLGFGKLRAPRVLEPSCGVGHFLGRAPLDESDLVPERVTMVELDPVTWAIARTLYPRADVRCQGFERAELPASYYDLVVGNVPFGDYQVADASGDVPKSACQQIHDYFVCRSVHLLRPGGVACLITSTGTLDKVSRATRLWLAERADLVAAYRLPGQDSPDGQSRGTFIENAGTEVTVDVLVLQKLREQRAVSREPNDGGAEVEWVGCEPVSFTGRYGGTLTGEVNTYYHSHPQHVLGEWTFNKLGYGGGGAGNGSIAVRRRDGEAHLSVADLIVRAARALPLDLLRSETAREKRVREAQAAPAALGDLTFATAQELALARVLRAVRAMLAAHESAPASLPGALVRLHTYYDAYVGTYGHLRHAERSVRHPLHKYVGERWWPLVAGLEDDAGRKSRLFNGPAVARAGHLPPPTALDAVYQLLDERGEFTPQTVAERLNEAA